jgi:hypothetical protein
MLENKLIADADIPTEFHKVVLETTGFDLTFTKKELDKVGVMSSWTNTKSTYLH